VRRLTESREFKAKLVTKLKERYGDYPEIEEEISKLVKNDALTQAAVEKLDAEFRTKYRRRLVSKLKPLNHTSRSPLSTTLHERMRPTAVTPEPGVSKPPTRATTFSTSEDHWATLANYEAVQVRDEELKRRQQEIAKKLKIREELDYQIQLKKTDITRYRQEMKDYELQLQQTLQKEIKEEQQAQELVRAKMVAERKMRDQFLRDNRQRKLDEAKELRTKENERLKMVSAELKAEEERREDKLKEERKMYSKVFKDNEQRQECRRLQELRERELDVKLADEYTRVVEEQERKRVEAQQARVERQQKLMARMENTVLKERSRKAKEEDITLVKQTELKEQREAEEDRRRKQKKLQVEQEMRQYQQAQINDRERQRELDKKTQEQQVKEWNEEAERLLKEVEAEKGTQRDKAAKHAELLKSQIAEQKKKTSTLMSPAEISLNKERLRAARRRLAEPIGN
jgi:hypothetical protein